MMDKSSKIPTWNFSSYLGGLRLDNYAYNYLGGDLDIAIQEFIQIGI